MSDSEGTVKGKVDIFVEEDPGGGWIVEIDPYLGLLDRDFQKMVWTLHTNIPGVSFVHPTGGIVFPWPPNLNPESGPEPAPVFTKWPGDDPTGNEKRYEADVHFRVPHGHPNQFYFYDIVLNTTTGVFRVPQVRRRDTHVVIDPPIENEPKP